jgi:hypothetical protein
LKLGEEKEGKNYTNMARQLEPGNVKFH